MTSRRSSGTNLLAQVIGKVLLPDKVVSPHFQSRGCSSASIVTRALWTSPSTSLRSYQEILLKNLTYNLHSFCRLLRITYDPQEFSRLNSLLSQATMDLIFSSFLIAFVMADPFTGDIPTFGTSQVSSSQTYHHRQVIPPAPLGICLDLCRDVDYKSCATNQCSAADECVTLGN